MGNLIGGVLVVLVILFIVFLILRELMCWYWKINTMISLLEDIRSGLSARNSAVSIAGSASVASADQGSDWEICPFCGEQSLKIKTTCEICGKQKR